MEILACNQKQRDSGADEDTEPYCIKCGSDDLAYLEQYANCSAYKCRMCGALRFWGLRLFLITAQWNRRRSGPLHSI